MKRVLLVALLLLAGCAKDNGSNNPQPPVVNELYVEELYKPYLNKFLSDAEFYGYSINLDNVVLSIRTKDMESNFTTLCSQEKIEINLRSRWIKEALIYPKNQVVEDDIWQDIIIKTLIYKALGNCVLGKDFNNNPMDLMYNGLIFDSMREIWQKQTIRYFFIDDAVEPLNDPEIYINYVPLNLN